LNRTFHQLTARDNGWFNANEIIKQTERDFVSANPDDFDELLPIFIYGTETQAKGAYPELDEAIAKCDLVIERHSMRIKRKEVNNWIDENYLTKGQANFYKQKYLEAERNFSYVSKKFKDHDEQHVATMWLVRTYGELQLFAKAQTAVDIILDDEDKLPKRFPHDELAAVRADIYLKKGEVDNAILQLERAIDLTKDRDDKVRWSFILAQLYVQKGKTEEAIKQYAAVAKMNPPYEIAFHAQIFQALASDRTADKKSIRAKLERMLKDEKHVDHYDKIHFALADIDLKENMRPEAIAHLRTSSAVSTTDTKQKAKSFLKLADIYFDDRTYSSAQKYYDSTSTVLDEEHPRYEEVQNKANVLNDLIEQLDIIVFEDSVQKVAGMDEDERKKFIKKLIRDKERAEADREQAEEDARELLASQPVQQTPNAVAGKGGWYFYDQAQISRGMSEFRKKWGGRSLEDDWRRKDKSGSALIDEEEVAQEESIGDGTGKEEGDEPWKNEEFYLKDLPLSDSALTASNERVCEAMYRAGIIYKEQLNDFDNGQESFEVLIDRFDDDCTYTPESFYQVYRIIKVKEQEVSYFGTPSTQYERIILNRYPGSEFAILIENPGQLAADSLKRKEESSFYEEVFGKFRTRSYGEVIMASNQVISGEPENHLVKKYYMLRAMSIGGMKDGDGMKNALKEIQTKFPNTEESKRAGELLAALSSVDLGNAPEESEKQTNYKSPGKEHYFILLFPKGKGSLNTIKSKVSDFNKKFFRNDNMKVTATLLDPNTQMVQVNLFESKERVEEYISVFEQTKEELRGVNDQGFEYYPIAPDNFATLFKTKDLVGYKAFFEANYK